MDISLTKAERDLLKIVQSAGIEAGTEPFVIGGFVRDKLLKIASKDIDIVCEDDAIHLAHLVSKKFKIPPTVHFFKTYGTAQIKLGKTEIEFVGARKESYLPESRNPEVTQGTLKDDQLRRDFTINAMAFSLANLENITIIDPFDGLADLEKGLIRTPADPEVTFNDDPLRMMRAIRFATQFHFQIVDEALFAIKALSHRIKIISKERIAVELNKIMMSDKPSIGFKLMEKTGLLQFILPELLALKGVDTIDSIGHKDNFYHSLQVLDNIVPNTDNVWLRYAALLHDIGKAKAKRYTAESGWTFHGHEVISARMIPKIFSSLKLPMNDAMPYVQKIVALHHRPISLTKDNITDSAIRRLLFDANEEIDDLMTMCEADITSKMEGKRERYLKNYLLVREKLREVEGNDRIRNWQPPISGDEIMEVFGLKPSPEVGQIKLAIREAILDGIIPNDRDAAYKFMLKEGEKLLQDRTHL